MDIFSLKEKTAIVTGAAGLLGQNHCKALAQAGANIVACDIDVDTCKKVISDFEGNHLAAELDVKNIESIQKVKDQVLGQFQHIDVLVNNAAINDMFENPLMAAEKSKFENYPLEMWQQSLDVNVTGVFLCCQIFGGSMAEQGSGSIINIASTYGVVAPDQSIYVDPSGKQLFYKSASYPTTKGAVISFTKFLAAYWGKKGVRVNSLSPGGVENNQEPYFIENYRKKTPMGRMAAPTDYQGALVFLASEASGYMTGANLIVDGGWTAV